MMAWMTPLLTMAPTEAVGSTLIATTFGALVARADAPIAAPQHAGDEEHESTGASADDATYEDDGDTTTPHVPHKAPQASGLLPGLSVPAIAPSLVR